MSEFGNAFRTARAAGKKTFKWNGKLYTTKLREEVNGSTTGKLPKHVPIPAQRPSTTTTATDSLVKSAASNSDMARGRQAERSVAVTSAASTNMKKVALPHVKAGLKAATEALKDAAYEIVRKPDPDKNESAWSGVAQRKREKYTGNMYGGYAAPEKKQADEKPKKKQGPFGLGGLFKLSKS